jgi:hypothetical protein
VVSRVKARSPVVEDEPVHSESVYVESVRFWMTNDNRSEKGGRGGGDSGEMEDPTLADGKVDGPEQLVGER